MCGITKSYLCHQRNAKTAVERRYTEALRGCGLKDDFLSRTGNGSPKSARKTSSASRSRYLLC